ncbi:MAG: bifunctional DNA-formamidopyrimidine glycosylase/DNA-(apurinic or apyrimidinic site) lyase [Pseudomonadaceae bacterium]|nr:bifunctional DNA-formamidopyrimidine glycosylase/DNA-(apurinic or apyrimidinic site) lyase [Pseudomonadaceae bacterium]
MPELPEVETTRRALIPLLEGQTLTAVTTSGKRLRQPVPPLDSLVGTTVTALARRAKYLLLGLSNSQTLLIHLGMSGRLTTAPPHAKHTHLTLTTAHASVSLYDPRRFGLILLTPTATLHNHPLLAPLGPEPLDDTAFTPTHLYASSHARNTPLKPFLMDARTVVGVGNIYASESLFRARLSPTMPAGKLTRKQAESLVEHIRQTLTDAIHAGGSSLRDYAHPSGQLGNFQSTFNVYGRKGQPCPACGTPITHITQAQRSTFYCPVCQK